jgi:ribosomal protein L11 methyltransferase
MYLWRRTADPRWLSACEGILQTHGQGLAIIARPGHKRLQLEIACRSQADSRKLVKEFGGKAQKLSRDWLKRFAGQSEAKSLKVGKRLVVTRSGGFKTAGASWKSPFLVIPASAAFGTGEHATTAMSLRFLEQVTRGLKRGWSLVDLGTGSGILALAASHFGAGSVIAIDADPLAISTAKANARLNKTDNVDFRVGDVRNFRPSRKIHIVTANLFSELLIEILPKVKRADWSILSGVLRAQEQDFIRALRRNRIDIVEVRHRGKWIAVLARVQRICRALEPRQAQIRGLTQCTPDS